MDKHGLYNRFKWWCFRYLFYRLCLYHRMKAILWTKQEHHKALKEQVGKALTDMDNWQKTSGNYTETTRGTTLTEISVKEYTTADLWEQAWSIAGKSLFYMRYFWPDALKNKRGQEQRVDAMCYHLAVERRNHFEDTAANRQWFRDWIEKFQNEVENQC